MIAQHLLREETLAWLLDPGSPGVHYLALRDLLRRPVDDPELRIARRAAQTDGPIAAVLAQMDGQGFWVTPGSGYNPKYRAEDVGRFRGQGATEPVGDITGAPGSRQR